MFIRIAKTGRVYLGDWDVLTSFYWVDGDPKEGKIIISRKGEKRTVKGVLKNNKFYTNWAGE